MKNKMASLTNKSTRQSAGDKLEYNNLLLYSYGTKLTWLSQVVFNSSGKAETWGHI